MAIPPSREKERYCSRELFMGGASSAYFRCAERKKAMREGVHKGTQKWGGLSATPVRESEWCERKAPQARRESTWARPALCATMLEEQTQAQPLQWRILGRRNAAGGKIKSLF
jgi:hypothetical protein